MAHAAGTATQPTNSLNFGWAANAFGAIKYVRYGFVHVYLETVHIHTDELDIYWYSFRDTCVKTIKKKQIRHRCERERAWCVPHNGNGQRTHEKILRILFSSLFFFSTFRNETNEITNYKDDEQTLDFERPESETWTLDSKTEIIHT